MGLELAKVARRKLRKPPPVLASCRVLAYAVLAGKPVRYAGHGLVFVNGKELRRVPGLAICESRNGAGILLLYCGRGWTILGMEPHGSVREAKARAERMYPGSARLWVNPRVSKGLARAFLNRVWKGWNCTLCGKRPDQVDSMIQRGKVRVCDVCVRELYYLLEEHTAVH